MKFAQLYHLLYESKSSMVYYHVTPTDNVRSIMKHGLVVGKGARSSQVEGEQNGVFLFENIDEAEDAGMNWLGDEFDEDVALCLLRINIPTKDIRNIRIEHDGFSYISLDDIPPEFISIENDNF